jgi:hypothetical protein
MKDHKQEAVAYAARCLGMHGNAACEILSQFWDLAVENGKLAALEELQDRFCVCMK